MKGLGMHIHHKHAGFDRKEYYRRFLMKDPQEGACVACRAPTRFKTIALGYHKFCCVKCAATSTEVRTKCSDTMVERFGATSAIANPKVMEKLRGTKIERYGDPAFNNLPKMCATKKSRYGHRFYTNQSKASATRMVRYGAAHCNPVESRKTNRLRYGVDWPMQNADILTKSHEAAFRYKPHTLPSGRVVRLRGYEPQALDWLLRSFSENELEVVGVPSIPYLYQGGEHRYFPDIWIPSRHLLVEVKSLYTLRVGFQVLQAKAEAVLAAGYAFSVILVKPDLKQVVEMTFATAADSSKWSEHVHRS